MLTQCILVIVSSALVAADSRLSQRVAEPGSDDMLQCYLRYVCASRQQDVLVLHNKLADVSRYVACLRAPFTLVNLRPYTGIRQTFYFGLKKPTDAFPEALRERVRRPHSLVVLLVVKRADIQFYCKLLDVMPHRNRGGRFLVVYLRDDWFLQEVFLTASKLFLFNMAALRRNDSRAYTYFPYGRGACGNRTEPEVLGQCQQLSFGQLFPAKVPKQFDGCGLHVDMYAVPPAVIELRTDTEQPQAVGYEVALVNIILKRLHLTGSLRAKEVKSFLIQYRTKCTHAYPYYTDTLVWHAPAAAPDAQWKSLLLVFQAPLWYAVLTFFLFYTMAWWLLGRAYAATAGTGAVSYVECVLGSLLALLGGSVPWPRSTGMRFLVGSWTLCTLVLVAAYQCQFLGFLLAPVYEKQIASEREMLASDVPPVLQPEQYHQFVQLWNPIREELMKRVNNNNFSDREPGKDYFFLQYALTTKYLARNYTDVRGRATVYLFQEPFVYQPLCLSSVVGHPTLDFFNRLLRLLAENGIVAKFMRDVDFSRHVSVPEPENVPITMHHLDFPFIALLLGSSLATVTFLLEWTVWYMMQKWRARVRVK